MAAAERLAKPSPAPVMVDLAGVSYRYPRATEPILRNVNLRIPSGTSVALMGANGTGKTTLLRILAGLLRPTEGTARVEARRVGYIPQQVGLVQRLPVLDNVLLGGLARASRWEVLSGSASAELRERAVRAIATVGLEGREAEPVARLSGGQRRRVAIARALVQQPDLLLADEFLANLDVVKAGELLELTREMRRAGVTLVLALHDLVLAKDAVDRIAFLKDNTVAAVLPAGHVTPEHIRWYLGHTA
jgi:phosphonate transport system ATP-binding protein